MHLFVLFVIIALKCKIIVYYNKKWLSSSGTKLRGATPPPEGNFQSSQPPLTGQAKHTFFQNTNLHIPFLTDVDVSQDKKHTSNMLLCFIEKYLQNVNISPSKMGYKIAVSAW